MRFPRVQLRDVRDVRSRLRYLAHFPGFFLPILKKRALTSTRPQDTEMLRILPSGTKGGYRIGRMSNVCRRQRDPETWEGLQRSSMEMAIR
jgi:hypothetical protein